MTRMAAHDASAVIENLVDKVQTAAALNDELFAMIAKVAAGSATWDDVGRWLDAWQSEGVADAMKDDLMQSVRQARDLLRRP